MPKLSRRLSPSILFLLSLNSIVGSGWLFAPLYAAKIAGPAAIVSWIIGGFAVGLIALTFAELSSLMPVTGGSAKIPQLSHGPLASFILGWIGWLTSLVLIPIEVQAILQYAYFYFPHLMTIAAGVPHLTAWGYLWAALLMLFLCVINMVSHKSLVRFNSLLFYIKFSTIFLTIFVVFKTQFSPQHFSTLPDYLTTTTGWQAIFKAISTAGIILAFTGFKSGVELAGETKNLNIAIPLSTIGAVLFCLLIYLGLQTCFIGAIPENNLLQGWPYLSFEGELGPFVGLAAVLGLAWLVKFLYSTALFSPLGSGLIYVTATARILYAMSEMGYVPKFLSQVNRQHLPVNAILFNFFIGMLVFLPLPGWQAMTNFLVSLIVITYAIGPIALLSFRYSQPNTPRPFRLACAKPICLLAFYSCTLFSYWTGWETVAKLGFISLVGVLLFFVAYWRGLLMISNQALRAGYWILYYLLGIVVLSYLGAYGGQNIIPFGWDFVVIAGFSLHCFSMALKAHKAFADEPHPVKFTKHLKLSLSN